jgi:hypothetical protein
MEANLSVRYVISQGSQIVAAILALWGIGYVAYMRYLHPLAKYPGPFIASLTDLWKAYTMYQGQMEYIVRNLHDKHGAIVRIGPNDLVISHPDAVKQIYLSGSSFLKVIPLEFMAYRRRNSTMDMSLVGFVQTSSPPKMSRSTQLDDANYHIVSRKRQSHR